MTEQKEDIDTAIDEKEEQESIIQYLPSPKSLVGGVFACAAFVALLGLWMQSSDVDLGSYFVEKFGIFGLFFGIMLIDTVPTPGGGIPFMALSLQGGIPAWAVVCTCFAGTLCAGMLGYMLGRYMGIPNFLSKWLNRKFPGKLEKIQKKGVIGVLALATMPVPISLATWAGGAFKVSLRSVLLALLIRIPKIILYLLTIQGGFSLL